MPTTEGYNGAFTGTQIDEAIGQVRNKNLPADGVKFTDGETFQQKYDAGELTGPQGLAGPQGETGPAGEKGDKGDTGAQGPKGDTGAQGPAGTAATITVGTVTTGEAGTNASVTNSGTSSAAVFNFTIPRGAKGDKGDKGDTGPAGADGAQGPAGASGQPHSVTVTLYAASWSDNAQTVSVTGVLADETAQLITPVPALASQSAYYEAGVLCTGQAAGQLVFECSTVPSVDLTVYVVIQSLA